MANQDTLTITRPDPSGAYTPIESGWDPTYADGGATWRPAASWSIAVADTGETSVTLAFTGSNVTVNGGSNVTMVIAHTGTVNTTIGNHSIVVTDADGGDQATGAFEAGTTISSDGTNVTIVWNSDDALGTDATGTVTILSNIDEPVTYSYSPALSVKGKKHLTLFHPAQADTETKCKYQWTDGESITIDGVEQAVWQDITSASASEVTTVLDSSVNADWAKLDKMAYVRAAVEITDDDVDGFADANTYDHPSNGCHVKVLDDDRTAESNTGVTISGIGADPS